MEQITSEQMEILNRLSGFCLSGEALEQEKKSLTSLLECFEQLQELDTSKVQLKSVLSSCENVLREDVPREIYCTEEMLNNAPGLRDGALVVPTTRKKQGSL